MQCLQGLPVDSSEVFHPCADGWKAVGRVVDSEGENGAGPITAHEMTELVALGSQVLGVVITGVHHKGDPFFHLKAIPSETGDLARVVGQKPQMVDAEVGKNLSSDPVIAQVGRKTQALIGFHRVQPPSWRL